MKDVNGLRVICLLWVCSVGLNLVHSTHASFEPSSKATREVNLELLDAFVYENGGKCSVDNGCLNLTTIYENASGNDILGNFSKSKIEARTTGKSIISLYLKEYDQFTIYEQVFENGIPDTSTGNKNGVATAWPVFRVPNATEAPGMRFVTPGGYMLGWTLYAQGSMDEGLDRFRYGENGGIVGLIQPGNGSVVMSALTEPMSVNVELVRGDDVLLQWGVQGLAESIPADYSIQLIVVYGPSFSRNVLKWGDLLRKFHNSFKISDQTVDYVGYWTDNGASHYYNPFPFKNFQNMLLDVHNYTVINDIPIRYVQIDSWWYYKGEGDGVKNWTAMPVVFPDGIEYLHTETGWPILAHNRYFSNDTDYAQQNGGDYPFTIDQTTSKALPLDKKFWDDLFDEALLWGLTTYEQDWLDRQYEGTSALHTNVTLGSWWLNSMGISAAERNLPIQYCMAFPRHFVHSVMLPAVTQIRVSDDYMFTPNQWRIGATSLFAHALDLKPYKDNFWSSKENKNVVFNDCELVIPFDITHPLELRHTYGGRQNYTKNGEPCVHWTTFGYDAKYPHSGMRLNLCRNPEEAKNGSFCYTKAAFDVPEEEWEWDFCEPPVCDVDCYTFIGKGFLGSYGMTESGRPCVDWDGEYDLNGTMCRNPTNERGTWCYVTEDHGEWDFCDNKCQEGIEPNPALQSAVSTLSTGPVGLGDRAENLDRDLILKSCRSDGLILKPSKPLTAIDFVFVSADYQEIWTSETDVSGIYGIVFLAEIDVSFTLSPYDLNLEAAFTTDVILYQNYPNELTGIQVIAAGSDVTLPSCGGHLEFCLFYTSPLLPAGPSRVALLGETSKWTPISSQRITAISTQDGEIEVQVLGVMGESVSFAFWDEDLSETFFVVCDFVLADFMVISVATRMCN